jgi:hypothetical protein
MTIDENGVTKAVIVPACSSGDVERRLLGMGYHAVLWVL